MARIDYRVRANVSDTDLNRLFRVAWKDYVDREFARVLEHSLGYVCAFKDGRLVGFVNVAWDGDAHGFLVDTTVHPRYRRRGVGRKLVKMAIEIAENAGLDWLHVDYEPDDAEFYRGFGFESTEAGLLNLSGARPTIGAMRKGLPVVVYLAVAAALVGVDVGAVLRTTPDAVAVARWACPLSAVAGLFAGAWFGRYFNRLFHFRGGHLFWSLLGCLAAAVGGVWLTALGFALTGSVAGWLVGWAGASLFTGWRRPTAPLVGAAGGCLTQAVWLDPAPALRFAVLGACIGVLSAPVFRGFYLLLGMLVLTYDPPHDERGET